MMTDLYLRHTDRRALIAALAALALLDADGHMLPELGAMAEIGVLHRDLPADAAPDAVPELVTDAAGVAFYHINVRLVGDLAGAADRATAAGADPAAVAAAVALLDQPPPVTPRQVWL